MLPAAIAIVKVISSPVIVPENEPGIRPCMPEKFMLPVIVDPLCVSGHVIVPMPTWPIKLPAPSEPDESDALPAHVPVIDIDPDGPVIELVPQAAANVNRTTAIVFFMMSGTPARRTPVETLRGPPDGRNTLVGSSPRRARHCGFFPRCRGEFRALTFAGERAAMPVIYFLIIVLLAGCILAMALRCAVTLAAKVDTRFASGLVDWTSCSRAVSWVFSSP